MNKYLYIVFIITGILILSSCKKNDDKKPFGAETIDYEQIEKVNNNGPIHESTTIENALPIADKVYIEENGPKHLVENEEKVEPTADLEPEPDFGGIPVVKKANQ